jgi:hypothetical protein
MCWLGADLQGDLQGGTQHSIQCRAGHSTAYFSTSNESDLREEIYCQVCWLGVNLQGDLQGRTQHSILKHKDGESNLKGGDYCQVCWLGASLQGSAREGSTTQL